MPRLSPWVPWVFLAIGAVVTWLSYPQFPDSWAVHYNSLGDADRFVEKSPLAVMFPFLIGAICLIVLEVVAWAVPARPPFPLADSWKGRLQDWQVQSLRIISCGIAAFMGVLAWVLPQVHSPHFLLLPVAALVALALFAPGWTLQVLMREMRREGVLPPGYVGLTYRNPDDPRILVPRLTGGGQTLNLAHWQAWLLFAALMAIPVGFIVVGLLKLVRS